MKLEELREKLNDGSLYRPAEPEPELESVAIRPIDISKITTAFGKFGDSLRNTAMKMAGLAGPMMGAIESARDAEMQMNQLASKPILGVDFAKEGDKTTIVSRKF